MLPDDAYVLCSDRPQSPNISLRAQTLDHRAQRQGQPVTVGSQQHLASQHQLLRASPHPIVRLMDAAHVVSDVVPDVVQAFRQTHTNRSRIEALEALAAELTPFEWRHLQSKLNTKDFRCDIVAALPVELVASIFAHLDVSTPYRLQRVSKCWHRLLCSPDILHRSLKEWDDRGNRGDGYALCRNRARNIHRFRMGNPANRLETFWYPANYGTTFLDIDDALVEDTFAWLLPGCRTLNICNFRTMAKSILHGDARELITKVALSGSVVAFATTLNTCYVQSLNDSKHKKFKLVRGMFEQLTCRDRTVICGGFVNDSAVIYTWDFDTQTGKSFDIGVQEFPFASRISECAGDRNLAILPDPHTKTMTIFASDRCHRQGEPRPGVVCQHAQPGCSIHYSRFTFDGERLQDSQVFFPNLTGLYLRRFHHVGSHGQFALMAIAHTSTIQSSERIYLPFDTQLNSFTNHNCPKPAYGAYVSEYISEKFAWWNDTYFELLPTERKIDDPRTPLLIHIGTSETLEKFNPQISVEPRYCDLTSTPRLFVNDKFAIVMYKNWKCELVTHVLAFEDECTLRSRMVPWRRSD